MEMDEVQILLAEVSPLLSISGVRVGWDSVLGRGSDAIVYAGAWEGCEVAVKVLHHLLVEPDNRGRMDFLRRFLSEGERLYNISHPNVVQFLGVFVGADPHSLLSSGRARVQSSALMMVTERMEVTLRMRYSTRPYLTNVEEIRVLCDVAAGLCYLHSMSLVHRDLTTSNVLLADCAGTVRAKIADVGLARSLHGHRPSAQVTDSPLTKVPGTYLYMSPEAIAAEAIYDQSLDIFSFGVLTMAMLVRREPSDALLSMAKVEWCPDGVAREIPEVRRRGDSLREVGEGHCLYKTIAKCLSNNPLDRPRAEELHRTLQGFLEEAEEEQRHEWLKPVRGFTSS